MGWTWWLIKIKRPKVVKNLQRLILYVWSIGLWFGLSLTTPWRLRTNDSLYLYQV